MPIEFITPLIGRGEDTSVLIQGGLIAQALRFTEILLTHTQNMSLTGETLDGKKHRFAFKIPTLPAFVYAKGLIFEELEYRVLRGDAKEGWDNIDIFGWFAR